MKTIFTSDDLSSIDIYNLLMEQRKYCEAKTSNFGVTALFKISINNQIFYTLGNNVEYDELLSGTCAEVGAIGAMVTAFGKEAKILEGWVMGASLDQTPNDSTKENNKDSNFCAPCGKCRQQIASFAQDGEILINMFDFYTGKIKSVTLNYLLPEAFSFKDIGKDNTQMSNIDTSNEAIENRIIRNKRLKPEDILHWLKTLESDSRATDIHNAVVIKLENGNYIAGVEVQNAAYPDSTMAIQNANSIAKSMFSNQKITEFWKLSKPLLPDLKLDNKQFFPSFTELGLVQVIKSPNLRVNYFDNEDKHFSTSFEEAILTRFKMEEKETPRKSSISPENFIKKEDKQISK